MNKEQFLKTLIDKSNSLTFFNSDQEHQCLSSLWEVMKEFAKECLDKKDTETLIELTSKIPSLMCFIKFDHNIEQDKENFKLVIQNLCNPDESFSSSSDSKTFSAFIHKVTTYLAKTWIKEHELFFDEQLLETLPNTENTKMLLVQVAELFIDNASDKQNAVILTHKAFKRHNQLYIPDTIGLICQPWVDSKVFNELRNYIEEGELWYFSSKGKHPFSKPKITRHKMFDKFYNQTEVDTFVLNAIEENSYACCKVLKRFHDRIDEDQTKSLLKEVIDFSYKSRTHSNHLKDVPQEVIDKYAEYAVGISQWCYSQLSDEVRTSLVGSIDFEEYLGLLAFHPQPDQVDSSLWKKAISQHEISYSAFPEHLISGDLAFSEKEWFELIQSVKGGNNKIFSALAKHHKEIITDSFLDMVATLKGTTAASHNLVATRVARLTFEEKTKVEHQNMFKVISEKDPEAIAKNLRSLMNKQMVNNDEFTTFIKAIQLSGAPQ